MASAAQLLAGSCHTGEVTTTASDSVVRLRGETDFLRIAEPLFAYMRREFACAAISGDTWSVARNRDVIRAHTRRQLAKGLPVRKLYNPTALTDQAFREHLHEMAALGADVRISRSTLANETIIIDKRVAILAGKLTGGGREFAVVRTPSVVAGVEALFTATWDAAPPLSAFDEIPQLPERGIEILRLLSEGDTDEAAARKLRLSVRTYRRRVAELMTALGAESRFQAGTRARKCGLL